MMEIKYPKNENKEVKYIGKDGNPVCILTSKNNREFFILYEVLSNGILNKLGRARSPTELEEKFQIHERMKR